MKKAGPNYKYQFELYRYTPSREGALAFSRLSGKPAFSPDAVAVYGDAYLYWLSSTGLITTCSRACAVKYAKTTGHFLLRTDFSQVAPEQEQFDAYAREHHLDNALAQLEADEALDPVSELNALLKAKVVIPERIGRLAMLVAVRGLFALARQAVDRIIATFAPSGRCYNICCPILQKIGDFERLDEIHEHMIQRYGDRFAEDAKFLSSWAWMIVARYPEKALALSHKAIAISPSLHTIIENHICVLRFADPNNALAFIQRNLALIKTDVGWFAAGRVLLGAGELEEALMVFTRAEAHEEDPLNKLYLADTLYKLKRFSEASEICSRALGQIETYITPSPVAVDQTHYSHEQKQSLRKGLLAVYGKSLIALGEDEGGRRMVRDAIDIQIDAGQQEPHLLDLQSFADGYLDRSQLAKELDRQQAVLDNTTERADRAEALSARLSQLLWSIKAIQPHWSGVLDDAVLAAEELFSQEEFTDVISGLCTELRDSDRSAYSRSLDAVSKRYPHLPQTVLQALATAEFLLLDHQASDLPIFAPVILEFAKACETAVNSVIVEPFIGWLRKNGHRDMTIRIEANNGKQVILCTDNHPRKGLPLGDLSLICSSRNQRWRTYVADCCGSQRNWVLLTLPNILDQIRGKRNGLAHYSSAERTQAKAVRDSISRSQLFESLDRLVETLLTVS